MAKMKNWLATGKFNEKYEYYTPRILVDPILEYVEKEDNSMNYLPYKN